jgi:3-phenylpropionate/trans-cinnamate dioxygenase ferredoxin reductase subunit
MDRLVVVGASLAGLRAAQAARAAGFTGELVIVGDEPHRPYTRPPLSKELLKGEHTPEQCALPQAATLEATWRLGTPAVALERSAKRVVLADGEAIAYDRVILATGCRARPWPGPEAELEGVHTLRSLDDALALRAALEPGRRLLIVGAGFIGCEVAASARARGAEVTVIDVAPQPMLPLGPELGARCGRLHTDRGVDLRLSTSLTALEGDGRVRAASLSDGSALEVDAVLMALGARPNTEWLAGSGLDLDPGVACDGTLTALGDVDVLAAGDLASWPHPLAGGERVRVEHWTVAAEHGQLAGRNALLEPAQRRPHVAAPYFWSDQYETKIQAVGFPALADRLEILEHDGERLVAVGARAGRVIGAVGFNHAKRVAWYRRQLVDPPALEELRAEVAA